MNFWQSHRVFGYCNQFSTAHALNRPYFYFRSNFVPNFELPVLRRLVALAPRFMRVLSEKRLLQCISAAHVQNPSYFYFRSIFQPNIRNSHRFFPISQRRLVAVTRRFMRISSENGFTAKFRNFGDCVVWVKFEEPPNSTYLLRSVSKAPLSVTLRSPVSK